MNKGVELSHSLKGKTAHKRKIRISLYNMAYCQREVNPTIIIWTEMISWQPKQNTACIRKVTTENDANDNDEKPTDY